MAVLNLRNIDPDLMKRLDHAAIDRGVSKRELVISMLEDAFAMRDGGWTLKRIGAKK